MHYRRFQRILFSCLALLLVGVLALTGDTPAYSNPDGSITFGMPAFIKTVHAEENSPSAFPDGEAGIAAYLKVGQAIILTEAKVTNIFRTIEAQTGDYIIGTVPLPDYDDNFYPKLYIHKDGWFMAYYNEVIPGEWIDAYEWRKRTLNSYWVPKPEEIKRMAGLFEDNPLVYVCGCGRLCKTCGHCLREYYATKERMRIELESGN